MRHNNKQTILGREKSPREAMLRNLAQSLILEGGLKTTEAKAKAVRPLVEKLITKAKKNTLAARREANKFLYTEEAVTKLMKEVGPRYQTRTSGYTRIIKIAPRRSDSAKMARIELV
ncbi:MAG TPA: 50S ribosomal protein L17 [Patescibacteria group bacterium]|nr:50S ribosomal protein L17 [Patescibacteria group bacterium]